MLENKYQQTSLLLSFNAAVMTSLEQKKRSHMKEETNHQRCLQSLQTLWFYAQLHLSDWTYREITYLLQAGCESCLSNKKTTHSKHWCERFYSLLEVFFSKLKMQWWQICTIIEQTSASRGLHSTLPHYSVWYWAFGLPAYSHVLMSPSSK